LSSAFLEDKIDGARESTLKTCVAAEKFISTKETAKSRWPLAYATFRHNVADQLGIKLMKMPL